MFWEGQFVVSEKIVINMEQDREWIQLILEAKNLGLEKEEIRSFLLGMKVEKNILE